MNRYLFYFLILAVLTAALLAGLTLGHFDNTSQAYFIFGAAVFFMIAVLGIGLVPKVLFHYQMYLNKKIYRRVSEDCNIYYNGTDIILCSCHSSVTGFQTSGSPMIRIPQTSEPEAIGNYVFDFLASSRMISEKEMMPGIKDLFKLADCEDEKQMIQNWNYLTVTKPLEGSHSNELEIKPAHRILKKGEDDTDRYGYVFDEVSHFIHPDPNTKSVGLAVLDIIHCF